MGSPIPVPNLPQDKNAWLAEDDWWVLPCGARMRMEVPMKETTDPAVSEYRTYAAAGPPNIQVYIPQARRAFWLTRPQRFHVQKLLRDGKRDQVNRYIAKLCR